MTFTASLSEIQSRDMVDLQTQNVITVAYQNSRSASYARSNLISNLAVMRNMGGRHGGSDHDL